MNTLHTTFRRLFAALAIAGLLFGSGLMARADDPIDLTIWRSLPVYSHGRVMPIDTFSMLVVEKVCESSKGKLFGKGKIELKLEGYIPEEHRLMEKYKGAYQLFPEGKARVWNSTELVLSWMSEPELWEEVPFITAGHEKLRKLLKVPPRDENDHPLRYVSPATVAQSQELRDYLKSTAIKVRQGGKVEDEKLHEEVHKMLDGYMLFRKLTFDPRLDVTISDATLGVVPGRGDRSRFVGQLAAAYTVLHPRSQGGDEDADLALTKKVQELQRDFQRMPDEAYQLVEGADAAATRLVQVYQALFELAGEKAAKDELQGIPLNNIENFVVAFRTATTQLAALARAEEKLVFESPSAGLTEKENAKLQALIREVAHKCNELERLGLEMHLSLYDGGTGPHIVPGLNPWALSTKRKQEDDTQPWISVSALLYGSQALLDFGNENGYPEKKVLEFRKSWDGLLASYRDHAAPNRPERIITAQRQLDGAVRDLATTLEERRISVVRRVLSAEDRDPSQLQYTAYPAPHGTAAELTYNAVDPFKWSWILSLASLLSFSLAWGKQRAVAFWSGMAILVGVVLWTAYGFSLRVMVTGWAPVTNMYETVIFVPFVVTVLGIWFILLPITWNGIETAWRLTAIPYSPEATPLNDEQRSLLGERVWFVGGAVLGFLRFALAAYVYLVLTKFHYADGGRSILQLMPDLSSTSSMDGALTRISVTVVQWAVLMVSLYILPRIALTLLLSVFTVPWTCTRDSARFGQWVEGVYPRLAFGLGTAFFSFAAMWVAWFAPVNVLNENFSPLQPVLRSNFWLTIHVLTIVASYGAGFLALMLGNIALGHYLFGRYRPPVIAAVPAQGYGPAKPQPTSEPLKLPPRAPEDCHSLADYAYRVVQVAVLLLATGTILGGLWADVSWGRFWGWDPKEVWALISLLVYLAILHGRFAGWFNDFGMIFGTVFGATMILMSWYGVNFVLPMLNNNESVGLHSYGSGTGGQEYVFSFVAVNWLFLAAASVRYWQQTSETMLPIVTEVEGLPPRDE